MLLNKIQRRLASQIPFFRKKLYNVNVLSIGNVSKSACQEVRQLGVVSVRKKAFALVEMLIVITIIGILTGIYLLTAGPAVERARASSCASDRATIRREYYLLRAAGGFTSSDFASAVRNELGRSGVSGDGATFSNICCDGGTYTCKTDENGAISIYCSVHDAPPATTISVGNLVAAAKRKLSLVMSSIRGR